MNDCLTAAQTLLTERGFERDLDPIPKFVENAVRYPLTYVEIDFPTGICTIAFDDRRGVWRIWAEAPDLSSAGFTEYHQHIETRRAPN